MELLLPLVVVALCYFSILQAIRSAHCLWLCELVPLITPYYSSQQTKDLLFHTAKVMAIAWSPNSAYIVSGSIDTNVIVWDVASGERDEIRGSVHVPSGLLCCSIPFHLLQEPIPCP